VRLLATLSLFVGGGLMWAADAPKPLTDSQKLEIRTLQLRLSRVEAAKLQIAAEEKTVTEALGKIVQEQAKAGCVLKDDLTCETPKPEPKKEKEK
jgi:hypothetical protein